MIVFCHLAQIIIGALIVGMKAGHQVAAGLFLSLCGVYCLTLWTIKEIVVPRIKEAEKRIKAQEDKS